MEFKKVNKKIEIIHQSIGYFSIAKFTFKTKTSNNILSEFIKTKFVLWKELSENIIEITNEKSENEFLEWKFHGQYDFNLLEPSDFKKVSSNNFISGFIEYLSLYVLDNNTVQKTKKEITELTKKYSEFYLLKNIDDNKIHKWSVFSYHKSGIGINKKINELTLIEFGLD